MEIKDNCTVYIDEAGDLGVHRGTQWFILTAVIVNKCDEPSIRSKIDSIKTKLNVNEIHIRKIKEFNRRAYITRELNQENFIYINILVDTNKFEPHLTPITAYNYLCRLLIERVSWYLRDNNKLADIILSSRGTSRDRELINYIKKLLPFTGNQVADMFLSITAKSASEWKLLQLADVCATTTFLSHEISQFDICYPCFASALSQHLYNRNGNVYKYGLKYLSDNMKPDKSYLRTKWICNK